MAIAPVIAGLAYPDGEFWVCSFPRNRARGVLWSPSWFLSCRDGGASRWV